MEMTFFLIIIFALIVGFGVLWYLLKGQKKQGSDDKSLLLLQNQMSDLTRTLGTGLKEVHESTRSQFGESTKIIKDITERLTKLDEANKQVLSFTEQLQHLQDILKNPKQRGVLGEYYLKTVLENVLPPGMHQMQYPFKDGTIVDAVVFTKDGTVPIDSKFSLENYNRFIEAREDKEREKYGTAVVNDLKQRIDETAKYVKPEEGTLNFAFMFIPSEAVYYDLLINKVGAIKDTSINLVEYAWKKNVIVVSPTTFLAYLQTVLHGLRALQVEESAQEIRKRVHDLGRHLASYETYMGKLGGHLGTTVSSYNKAYKEFGKIDKDVLKISGKEMGSEPLTIEEPEEETD